FADDRAGSEQDISITDSEEVSEAQTKPLISVEAYGDDPTP
ncbi:3901_t:CDS:1, partial [Funneliformis geosporum]